ncbi:MAG: copper chaperone CopZ [Peptococcaceae bacterium]|jgi:copper chaperone|nr:copper chaperone CopZ [Peptococcaceae bacterium]
MTNTTLKVGGMSCEHCVKAVTNAVSGLAGVAGVKVSLRDGAAEVKYDPAKVTLEAIKAAIAEEGYDV